MLQWIFVRKFLSKVIIFLWVTFSDGSLLGLRLGTFLRFFMETTRFINLHSHQEYVDPISLSLTAQFQLKFLNFNLNVLGLTVSSKMYYPKLKFLWLTCEVKLFFRYLSVTSFLFCKLPILFSFVFEKICFSYQSVFSAYLLRTATLLIIPGFPPGVICC